MMALPPLLPRTPAYVCKVCGSLATWLGAVDFSKWCSHDLRSTPTVGVNVDYYRCAVCGLLFSPSFDRFTSEDWRNHVYNAGYLSIDPDYTGGRGRNIAESIATTFPLASSLHVIDYGCGLGTLGDTLRTLNWPNVINYDPFVPKYSSRPTSRAELVIAVEVLEHSNNPVATFDEIASLRSPSGIIFATTLFVPMDADASILDWWYVAPRNGHVTIHSAKSLSMLGGRHHLKLASASAGNLHFLWHSRPDWAAAVLPP
jgi:hypothetical protein